MAGCLKGALDLAEPNRLKYLHYFADLLQDASDLSFNSVKACHAIVFTTMEHDMVSWQDTSDLDCFRHRYRTNTRFELSIQNNGRARENLPTSTNFTMEVLGMVKLMQRKIMLRKLMQKLKML